MGQGEYKMLTQSIATRRLIPQTDIFNDLLPTLGFNMPPPPLPHNPASAGNNATAVDETPVKGRAKKGGKAIDVDVGVTPGAPKRRGRPLGSKNKPKNT
jgi:hypothetical protein